ncbi:hypothetical protein D6D23_04757 [Aureobasidium pullulans]|nr:hypothetical protein D6D23_04757 [Aureobasidium pullulans]
MSFSLNAWFESEKTGQWGASPVHTNTLDVLFYRKISAEHAAERLLSDVNLRDSTQENAWGFWNLLFHAAASLPDHVDVLVQLILAIRQAEASPEGPNKLTQSLWSSWDDAHSFYYTWRTLDSSKSDLSSDNLTGADRWINFTSFSAKLVQQGDEMFMRECGIQAFFDMRDALETTLCSHANTLLPHSTTSAEECLTTDIEAAACWIIHGGSKLQSVSNESFGSGWSRGLSRKTEFWDGEPGFSTDRWHFWAQRLETLAKEEFMSERAKEPVTKAVKLIEEVARAPIWSIAKEPCASI